MTTPALLAAATALASLAAVPAALATVDPPKSSDLDQRMRTVTYDPNNPVLLPASPGVSLRLILGGDEHVERVIVSDQTIISPDPDEDEAPPRSTIVTAIDGVNTALTTKPAQGGGQSNKAPVCDANLCVDIMGNFIYLKPKRYLSRQPMFVQTSRMDPITARKIMVPYTFELVADDPDAKPVVADASFKDRGPAEAMWSVTFIFPARERAERLAEARKAAAARFAAQRERRAMLPPPMPGPAATDNHRYGYKGSAAVKPDDGWDDGRTTFLRFKGNRRLPNIYEKGPDGKPTLARWATEPDATGATLRLAGTETVWTLRDGDEAGCVINGGRDPDGRTAPTVSPFAGAGR